MCLISVVLYGGGLGGGRVPGSAALLSRPQAHTSRVGARHQLLADWGLAADAATIIRHDGGSLTGRQRGGLYAALRLQPLGLARRPAPRKLTRRLPLQPRARWSVSASLSNPASTTAVSA